MSTQDSLEQHPLMQALHSNIVPDLAGVKDDLINHFEKTGKFRLEGREKSLLEHQIYNISVFRALVTIFDSIKTLRHSQKFITKFPTPRKYEKDGVSYDIWIEYHYVYFIITLVGILDMALILTNTVFRLGYQKKDCKLHLIKSNLWIENTPVKKALEKLSKIIEPHKNPRNLYVHRGETPRIDLIMNSDEYDRLKALTSLEMITSVPAMSKRTIDAGYKKEIEKIIKKLDEEIIKISIAISELFDSLQSTYEKNSTLLHKVFELSMNIKRKNNQPKLK